MAANIILKTDSGNIINSIATLESKGEVTVGKEALDSVEVYAKQGTEHTRNGVIQFDETKMINAILRKKGEFRYINSYATKNDAMQALGQQVIPNDSMYAGCQWQGGDIIFILENFQWSEKMPDGTSIVRNCESGQGLILVDAAMEPLITITNPIEGWRLLSPAFNVLKADVEDLKNRLLNLTNLYQIQASLTPTQINALDPNTLQNGWVYNVTENGTIGSIPVLEGDNVVWTANGWDKLSATLTMDFAFPKVNDVIVNNDSLTFEKQLTKDATPTESNIVFGDGLKTTKNAETLLVENKVSSSAEIKTDTSSLPPIPYLEITNVDKNETETKAIVKFGQHIIKSKTGNTLLIEGEGHQVIIKNDPSDPDYGTYNYQQTIGNYTYNAILDFDDAFFVKNVNNYLGSQTLNVSLNQQNVSSMVENKIKDNIADYTYEEKKNDIADYVIESKKDVLEEDIQKDLFGDDLIISKDPIIYNEGYDKTKKSTPTQLKSYHFSNEYIENQESWETLSSGEFVEIKLSEEKISIEKNIDGIEFTTLSGGNFLNSYLYTGEEGNTASIKHKLILRDQNNDYVIFEKETIDSEAYGFNDSYFSFKKISGQHEIELTKFDSGLRAKDDSDKYNIKDLNDTTYIEKEINIPLGEYDLILVIENTMVQPDSEVYYYLNERQSTRVILYSGNIQYLNNVHYQGTEDGVYLSSAGLIIKNKNDYFYIEKTENGLVWKTNLTPSI